MRSLTVNGDPHQTRASTLAELLAELGLAGKPVAAERNGAVVPKREHPATHLQEDDRIELVTLVGGG